MYTFSGKNNLVWSSFILFNNHPELNQEYSLDIELPEKRKFNKLPYWVYDKHVSGGNKGYQFFFDNSLVVNENIWGEGGDKYAEECKKVYLDDEKSLGNGKTKVLYNIWKNHKDNYEKYIPGYYNVVQTQLITARGKPQVYYATCEKDNKKYVLKGPIKIEMRKQIMRTEKIKKIKIKSLKCRIYQYK